MEKIRNLSLKKTIILYTIISLLCSFFLSAFIIRSAITIQERIWGKYVDKEEYADKEEYYEAQGEYGKNTMSISRVSKYEMSEIDGYISELCDFIETYTVLLLSIAGSSIAVVWFYRNKLKAPIEELSKASEKIAMDELEFHIVYQNQDELGQLCKEFEKMRMQLAENNRTVWHMVEEEKTLRAAIAHDIRSPLSVLKGYQEMLLEFVPEETIDKEKIIEMLQEGMKQIDRMNNFIETMRKMTSLEEREFKFNSMDLQTMGKRIGNEAQMISKNTDKDCSVKVMESDEAFCVDEEVVLEVVDNLLSNALRYAKKTVEIDISAVGDNVIISVADDGKGFTEDVDTVTKAFYHANSQDDLNHFGLGMYISRIYCEKHGGRLLAENQKYKGAVVKAIFKSNR